MRWLTAILVLLAFCGGCSYDWGQCDFEQVKVTSDCVDRKFGATSVEFCKVPAGCFRMGSPEDEPCRNKTAAYSIGILETRHPVTLTRSFEISRHEVTALDFKNLLPDVIEEANPDDVCSQKGDPRCPMNEVTWVHAALFCNALSKADKLPACYQESNGETDCKLIHAAIDGKVGLVDKKLLPHNGPCLDSTQSCIKYAGEHTLGWCTGASLSKSYDSIYDCPGYRLPTEAEWEHAYRAGTTTPFFVALQGPWGCEETVEELARYAKHGTDLLRPMPKGPMVHLVGSTEPNALGLHDMAGNLFEWTHDVIERDLGSEPQTDPQRSEGAYRVIRGGAPDHEFKWPRGIRAAHRQRYRIFGRYNALGFRCVRTLD